MQTWSSFIAHKLSCLPGDVSPKSLLSFNNFQVEERISLAHLKIQQVSVLCPSQFSRLFIGSLNTSFRLCFVQLAESFVGKFL